MSDEIRALEPAALWNNFADLNEVPRASKKRGESNRIYEAVWGVARLANNG